MVVYENLVAEHLARSEFKIKAHINDNNYQ